MHWIFLRMIVSIVCVCVCSFIDLFDWFVKKQFYYPNALGRAFRIFNHKLFT